MKDTPVVSQDLVVGESEVRCPTSSPVTDISDESVIHHSRCTRCLFHPCQQPFSDVPDHVFMGHGTSGCTYIANMHSGRRLGQAWRRRCWAMKVGCQWIKFTMRFWRSHYHLDTFKGWVNAFRIFPLAWARHSLAPRREHSLRFGILSSGV